MRVSQQILEWQAETRRADLLRLLEKRCKTPIPADLMAAVHAIKDMDLLLCWFDAATNVNSFEEFRAVMQPQH